MAKIISVFALLVIVIAGFLFIKNENSSNENPPNEINQKNINIQPTQGMITEISEESIEYKDSILVKLENDPTNIYVTNETQVKDADGNSLEREVLNTGMQVAVIAEPTEGGIEAREVIVIK